MESVREAATLQGNGTETPAGVSLRETPETLGTVTPDSTIVLAGARGNVSSLGEQAPSRPESSGEEHVGALGLPRQRRKRHVFTEYEDKLLMKVVERRPGERKRELERLAGLFGVPYLTLRHRFYTVIKKRISDAPAGTVAEAVKHSAETVTTSEAQGREPEEEWAHPTHDPMEELLTLPARVERIEKRLSGMLDLKGFIDRLIDINKQLDREQQLLEELARKEREIQRMKEDLQKKIQRINAREEELSDLYSQLETTLHQFMNLSSIDKLKVLGDFTVRVETVIDRFGNVIRRRPVVVP